MEPSAFNRLTGLERAKDWFPYVIDTPTPAPVKLSDSQTLLDVSRKPWLIYKREKITVLSRLSNETHVIFESPPNKPL